MAKAVKKTNTIQDISIGSNDGHNRSESKKAEIEAFARKHHAQRSPERIIKNEMLAIRYRMEEYINNHEITLENVRTIHDFVSEFLKILHLKKKDFAHHIEVDDSNLNKYYNNQRSFNPELAMKFGHFFHTPADLWLKLQYKNELLEFQRFAESIKKYEKYDYEKVLAQPS